MKKKFLLVAIVALAFSSMNMVKAGGVYEGVAPGKSILGVRLGLSNTVGANVTYDYALARVWKGTFTIGGQVGYMWKGGSTKVNGNGATAKYKWNDNMLDFKIRTTYRFNVVVPEWEVYGGVGLGGWVDIWNNKAKVSVAGEKAKDGTHGTTGNISGSFILGTSYNFTQNIGVNLEFDFGNWEQAWVNLGVNFKF